jgi:ABC-type bacteriocin/lantibiotic exporter with double-glycine peptidase domain
VVGMDNNIVPFGLFSLLSFLTPLGVISFVVFLGIMIITDKVLASRNYSLGKRILLNLIALLVITQVIDFVRATPLESWNIFLNGGSSQYNFRW